MTADSREDVMDEMIRTLSGNDVLTDNKAFKQVILDREAQGSTGLGMNVAIPHGKADVVKKPAVAFGIHRQGVDWNSMDGTNAKLIFMIAVPEERAGDDHLRILQMLSRKLMDEEFREKLIQAENKQQIYKLLDEI